MYKIYKHNRINIHISRFEKKNFSFNFQFDPHPHPLHPPHAKVDQGVHLFFSFPTNLVSNKVKSMLLNNIYKQSIDHVKFEFNYLLQIFVIAGKKILNQDEKRMCTWQQVLFLAGYKNRESCVYISAVGIRGIFLSLTLGTAKFKQLYKSCSLKKNMNTLICFSCELKSWKKSWTSISYFFSRVQAPVYGVYI